MFEGKGLTCIQILFGLVVAISMGCSQATGPFFQPVEHFGSDRAIVYLYFPIQQGYRSRHTILANGTVLTRLDTEGYYPFVTPPGRITFAMEGWPEKRNVTVAVEAGRVYFVRATLIGRGIFTYNAYYQLELVASEEAMREIQGLRLMGSCRTIQGCGGVE